MEQNRIKYIALEVRVHMNICEFRNAHDATQISYMMSTIQYVLLLLCLHRLHISSSNTSRSVVYEESSLSLLDQHSIDSGKDAPYQASRIHYASTVKSMFRPTVTSSVIICDPVVATRAVTISDIQLDCHGQRIKMAPQEHLNYQNVMFSVMLY